MKSVNIMNFVRQIDERTENSTERLLAFTTEQLHLLNQYGLNNTFLLQYDALVNNDFVSLFKNEATDKTELGLWYEIVEPLTTACGLPYRSENGWKWDWHIIPGFSMAYTPHQRELLIDEAMRKFKETFGYYPQTVASWVIDTHTLNYLAANYDIKAVAICRDQANTDAYTLLGGYFNQAYYPSINNIFTPAQTQKMQVNIPVFRLLGPCPIHNYDSAKYCSEDIKALRGRSACFTLEPCWYMGSTPEITQWMFDSYYGEESLGFAYAQIGQENSFLRVQDQVLEGTKRQIDQLLSRGDIEFQTMAQTGAEFMNRFPKETPPTAVIAKDNWDTPDIQSVYYDCKNYMANLFRYEEAVFFRCFYLFDERIKDLYLENTCATFDAIYENLPIIDTMNLPQKKQIGLILADAHSPIQTIKEGDGILKATFGNKSVTFYDCRIEIVAEKLLLDRASIKAEITVAADGIAFHYKGNNYRLKIEGGRIIEWEKQIEIQATDSMIVLYPTVE